MRLYFLSILFFCANVALAQKKVLTPLAYDNWPSLGAPQLSNDGRHLLYTVKNIPIGSRTVMVQSTDGIWKKEFTGVQQEFQFTSDGKYLVFKTMDTLCVLNLTTHIIQYIPNTRTYSLQETPGGELLCYMSSYDSGLLSVKNLKTSKFQSFSGVITWKFSEDGRIFLMQRAVDKMQALYWVDLFSRREFDVSGAEGTENLIIDSKGNQLVFKKLDSILVYRKGMKKPICLFNNKSLPDSSNLMLDKINHFSKDGTRLFITLRTIREANPSGNVVEVWSFRNARLPSEQEFGSNEKSYQAVVNLSNGKITLLQSANEEISEISFPASKWASDTLALVVQRQRYFEFWNSASRPLISLLSTIDGSRKTLDLPQGVSISSFGKYLIYFNRDKTSYFCYEIATGIRRNLTKQLKVNWSDTGRDDFPGGASTRGSIIWLKDDSSVLICDQFDIWKLDPLNLKKPINLTNGYGKKHSIVFNSTFGEDINGLGKHNKLYLTAFDKNDKRNGFYLGRTDKAQDPELLTMGDYIFCTSSAYVPTGSDFTPIRAKSTNTYVVRRMSATAFPNYFSTKDFKTFVKLSDLSPETEYNWLRTELHTWKSLDGRTLQGILYKPEDFSPDKIYPIIIHYYERKSDGLNAFLKPEYVSDGMNINIPSYVSQGYLVFSPDIFYRVGDPMQGTYDAIVSAAKYLSRLPFVDERKIGIQGGSFGGIQTNYLVGRSNIFRAAVSCSGKADWISGYGSIVMPYGSTAQDTYETGQSRIGGSLWEKKSAYIKNSAIFQVDRITTPLLLMHGKQDPVCPFANILEFFTGLRRMGKTAWMLAYPNSSHGLRGDDIQDFGIRMFQFFNYYLKDKAPPRWMTNEIPGSKPHTQTGLELDSARRIIGPNLLTIKEQDKVDSLMVLDKSRTQITKKNN